MSFDIYGNNLRRGHCEVHPHVHEEYPCSVCIAEASQREQQQRPPYCDGDPRFCESAHYLAQASEHIKDQERTMATQQARIEALKAAIGNINTQKEIVMKYAKESDRLMAVGRMYQAIADAAALLQEPTND